METALENAKPLFSQHKKELFALYLSTFLLRTGFGGVILLFDWTLVWALEYALGVENTASIFSIILISFSAITYYIAEVTLTGYYGNRSDKLGPKPVILYATIGAGVLILFYMPGPLIFEHVTNDLIISLLLMAAYMAIIHFLHGVFASAKVAPTLGFINKYSTVDNRALHMAWYDNAILYGRAFGILLGGALWIFLGVDNVTGESLQSHRIAFTFPFLSILLVIATLLIVYGLTDVPPTGEKHNFSIKNDIQIAARVMLHKDRRPLLLPWVSIAAIIGSGSLWAPTVFFILSKDKTSHRGFDALLPLMFVLGGLALPAPLWGMFADRKGRKKTLLIGLFGLPIMGLLGLLIGFPFYRSDISSSNIYLLISILPGMFMFSAMIPVLMGALGDTSVADSHGEVMSGYHFVIALGEIVGVLAGGFMLVFFSFIQDITHIFGPGDKGAGYAILIGFLLLEVILTLGMVFGIYRLPDRYGKHHLSSTE